MPKIFEYFGFVFFFYSNEHEPIHVHVIHGDCQMIYELVMDGGKLNSLVRRSAKGYLPLSQHDAKTVDEFIRVYALDIVQKWIDYFVLKKPVQCTHIKTMNIVEAVYSGDLSLKLTFSDGVVHVVDFGDYIRSHPHPQYDKYLDPEVFQTFSLESGNVVWGDDWDMVFPIENLYSGHIL